MIDPKKPAWSPDWDRMITERIAVSIILRAGASSRTGGAGSNSVRLVGLALWLGA
jgi:hypothetical protein